MKDEDFGLLEVELDRLKEQASVAFIAALTERMLHNYRLYHALTGYGDRKRVDSIMALVWESLITPEAKINFSLQQEKLSLVENTLEEDSADDASFGARMAGDAILALSVCLEASMGPRPDGALEISRLSRQGVETFIRLTEEYEIEEELDRLIVQHPLFADEMNFQYEVLERVTDRLKADRLRQLKQLARNDGVSNVGLSLDEE